MARHKHYTVADYGAMIDDAVRAGAYLRALKQVVTPDAVVIDIGTGTGVFAVLACRFGARRVYAIEPEDVIDVARDIAAANGCRDRIVFLQAMSTDVSLPERADVIVSDLAGALPWFRRHIPSIIDARCRLLAPGGVMIPKSDTAWAAVVDVRELYRRRTGPWHPGGLDVNMEAARRIATNTTTSLDVAAENLITPPQRWARLDYAQVEDCDVRGCATWTVTAAGTGHGVAIGFDRTVCDGISFSNAPDRALEDRTKIYGNRFLPWPEPVALDEGDVVTVDLEARLVRSDYLWNWNTEVRRPNGGRQTAQFRQSTFFGVPLSAATLHAHAVNRVATLNEDGRITQRVLQLIGRGVRLDEIAETLTAEFSTRFVNAHEAVCRVVELARQYS